MCTYAEKPGVIESNEPGKLGTDALTDGYNIFLDPRLKDEEKDFAVSHEYYHYLQKMQQKLKGENYSPGG